MLEYVLVVASLLVVTAIVAHFTSAAFDRANRTGNLISSDCP